nr:hypothetical protein [Lysinibacillus timonensis]
MNETQWDIKVVKRLKMKLLVQYNLVSLLLFVLFGYFATNGNPYLLMGGICVLLWISVAITLYNLIAVKPIGTKTSRMVQEFDRNHLGQKRWKRRNLIEVIFGSIICVFITFFMFVNDFNSVSLDFPIVAFPFIGAWVGYNIGEIFRISNL